MPTFTRWSHAWEPPLPFGWANQERRPPAQIRDFDQLELFGYVEPQRSITPPSALEQLRTWLERTGLSQRDFALHVLGRDVGTLQRYLLGARISHSQRCWLQRLESVHVHGDRIVIVLRPGRRLKDWRDWRRTRKRVREWEKQLRAKIARS